MSTALAAPSSASQSQRHMSREPQDTRRPPSRSSPRSQAAAAIAYGPIGGTSKSTNSYRRSPGSPRSQNEDERAASALQALTNGGYGKIGAIASPRSAQQQSRSKASAETSPSSVPRIKTEHPASPDLSKQGPARHRPRKLDLTGDMPSNRATPSAHPQTASLSAMHDVGLLCLSPGFQTQDSAKQQQLAKSMEVREQQRQLIESRLHDVATGKHVETEKPHSGGGSGAGSPPNGQTKETFAKPPGTSKRKGPPPGLSINAPSAHQFANEPRVIQSAPINHSFTGLKPAPAHEHPLSRQVLQHTHHHNQFHASSSTSNPPPQFAPLGGHQNTGQRLPPISDVMASQEMNLPNNPYGEQRDNRTLYAPHNNNTGPMPSPGYPPPPSAGLHPPPTGQSTSRSRDRDFRSADEAVHSLSGGREDLLPKIVHYNGHNPPTPPTPNHPNGHPQAQYAPLNSSNTSYNNGPSRPDIGNRTVSGPRRRGRDEFEADLRDQGPPPPFLATPNMSNTSDRMDIDRNDDRGRVSERERERRRMEEREQRERGAQVQFEEAMRGGLSSREEWIARQGEGAQAEERMKRRREDFLATCARAWDMLHEQ